jgi:protein TonB
MKLRSVRETGDYALGAVVAVLLVGTVYVGVMSLNQAIQPRRLPEAEGAIRLARAERDKPAEPPKREKLEESKPPEHLPKIVSARARTKAVKPRMDLSTPRFAAVMHSGLTGGIVLPKMVLGGVGFNLSEVDEAPAVLTSMPPQYPYGAKRRHVEGEVVVRMLVNGQGDPVRLSIHKSDPPGVFDKAALSAAQRWKFRPGRYKGEAVDTWVLLPFKFELTR